MGVYQNQILVSIFHDLGSRQNLKLILATKKKKRKKFLIFFLISCDDWHGGTNNSAVCESTE